MRYAVFGALKERFPDIKRYGEEIKQGLQEPSFFVKLLSSAQDREFGRRYSRSHSFDIHFFGKTNEEIHATAEQLYDCMEYITVGAGVCRGRSMSHEIVDGVLHFFVTYAVHLQRIKPEVPSMQSLDQRGNIKK